jgi:DNA-directed RNA polymerase beta' subunit
LTTKLYRHENKNQEGWTSQDIRIYNTVLCRILEQLCGKLSHNKFVHPKIVFSNRECILGFLDAYIGGDGCVNLSSNPKSINKNGERRCEYISVHSVSCPMLLDVQLMLKNLGIISIIKKIKKQETNNRGSINLKQPYNILIRNKQGKKLASMLHMKIKEKQEKAVRLAKTDFKYKVDKEYLTIPNNIDGQIVFQVRDDELCKDLIFDKISSIEEVPNTTKYAYDLTVQETRNFDCINGLCIKDTFHSSGVASKSNVTRGVPRIEEIIRLTKNPKNPSMSIYLREMDRENHEKAKLFATMLEHTRLVDIVQTMQIIFDPMDEHTKIAKDEIVLKQFYEFENQILGQHVVKLSGKDQNVVKSKWVVRLTMNREIMLDKNITMDDVHFAIKNSHEGNDIDCVFSDYNMENLVFRIRVNANIFKKSKKSTGSKTLDQSDEIYLLKNFQQSLLTNIVLRGVVGIENVIPRKLATTFIDKRDGKYVLLNDTTSAPIKKDIWILDTTGTNLLQILGVDYIDSTRTITNDIKEINNVLGIEASRQIIYREFFDVMDYSGVYINHHHLSILADRMTCTKEMTAIFRSGILNDNIGPIAKATFEVHTEVLLDAARHGEFDAMRGISANVMSGQYGYYGTNSFNLLLDLEQMTKDKQLVFRNRELEIETALGNVEDGKCSNIQIHSTIDMKKGNTVFCNEDVMDVGF